MSELMQQVRDVPNWLNFYGASRQGYQPVGADRSWPQVEVSSCSSCRVLEANLLLPYRSTYRHRILRARQISTKKLQRPA